MVMLCGAAVVDVEVVTVDDVVATTVVVVVEGVTSLGAHAEKRTATTRPTSHRWLTVLMRERDYPSPASASRAR
jgi:hypothetical protein